MSLRASLNHQGEITIVTLEGKLDYENQDVLRENILDLIQQGQKVIVDMEGLRFVGSSGITHFIRSLYEFRQAGYDVPRLCNLRSEFRQIISSYDINKEFSIHESCDAAKKDFFRSGKHENH